MTKTYCDRCKEEIVYIDEKDVRFRHKYSIYKSLAPEPPPIAVGYSHVEICLCTKCTNEFIRFLNDLDSKSVSDTGKE